MAITREVSTAGGDRWVKEWVSIKLVGQRQAWVLGAKQCVWGGSEGAEFGRVPGRVRQWSRSVKTA
jgi:hypothetical protein